MDISGRWQYHKERWSEANKTSSSDHKLFENSIMFKYLEYSQFELIISKIRVDETEESLLILLKAPKSPFVEERSSLTRLNSPSTEPGHLVSLLISCDAGLIGFTRLRLGPKADQTCSEHFKIDGQNHLHVIVTAVDEKGRKVTITRSFERIEDNNSLRPVTFGTTEKTRGWDEIKYFPPQMLELVQLKLQSVFRYKDDINSPEILFSPSQTAEQKQLVAFGDEYQHFSHIFQFEVGFLSLDVAGNYSFPFS
jgi:hypothetical protein